MIKIAKLQHYQALLKQSDVSTSDLLAGTGLAAEDLGHPDMTISTAQYQKAIENILASTGDPSFGLRCGQQLSLLDMGMTGFVLHSSKSLREALNLWFSYSSPIYGDIIKAKLVEFSDHWALEASIALPLGSAYQFCLDEFLMLCLHTGASVQADKKIIYRHIHMPTPSTRYVSDYEALFGCPIKFGMPTISIGVAYPGLDVPIHSEPEAYQTLYNEFCRLMQSARPQYGETSLLVRNELIKSPGEIPLLHDVASNLNRSERTLKRDLQNEGNSFRGLVNEFRCDLAKHFLKQTNFSVVQIAYQLGYTDSKPFQRAFKKWLGISPGQYRKQLTS